MAGWPCLPQWATHRQCSPRSRGRGQAGPGGPGRGGRSAPSQRVGWRRRSGGGTREEEGGGGLLGGSRWGGLERTWGTRKVLGLARRGRGMVGVAGAGPFYGRPVCRTARGKNRHTVFDRRKPGRNAGNRHRADIDVACRRWLPNTSCNPRGRWRLAADGCGGGPPDRQGGLSCRTDRQSPAGSGHPHSPAAPGHAHLPVSVHSNPRHANPPGRPADCSSRCPPPRCRRRSASDSRSGTPGGRGGTQRRLAGTACGAAAGYQPDNRARGLVSRTTLAHVA